jgi:hypothetical protein
VEANQGVSPKNTPETGLTEGAPSSLEDNNARLRTWCLVHQQLLGALAISLSPQLQEKDRVDMGWSLEGQGHSSRHRCIRSSQ